MINYTDIKRLSIMIRTSDVCDQVILIDCQKKHPQHPKNKHFLLNSQKRELFVSKCVLTVGRWTTAGER